MNFKVLLARSRFGRFAQVLLPSYPDPVEQSLINSMIQILWDRGEANGYAWHMTRDPIRARRAKVVRTRPSATIRWRTSPPRSRRVIGARLRTPARPWAQPRQAALLRDPAHRAAAVLRQRARRVRHRPPARRPRHAAGAAPRTRRRRVDPHSLTGFSVPAGLQFSGVPQDRRDLRRHLCRQAVLRGRLDRTVDR